MEWIDSILAKKHTRRAIPVSDSKEVYVREINILHGGLGCATWDGGVILARWIEQHRSIFENANALELGCGVGISGIIAAEHTERIVISDYLPEVMENARYNFQVNLDHEKLSKVEFCMLDWHQFLEAGEKPKTEEHFCTKISHDSTFVEQKWYSCETCFDDPVKGVCEPCFDAYHSNHVKDPKPNYSTFRCDCAHFHCARKPDLAPRTFDIIFGSELIYSPLSCDALTATVDYLLAENGVFYQILQVKREGVEMFCARMNAKGFKCSVSLVPAEFLTNTNTRSWQRKGYEDFFFFTWTRGK